LKHRRAILFFVLFVVGIAALWLWREEARERKFIPQMNAAAKRYKVDPALVKAIVWRESRFNSDARGTHGEIGLMQIQEIAAQEWADSEHNLFFQHEHCFDPTTNTLAATFYLAKLMKRYSQTDNPVPYALADYNAGRGNVLKWNTGAAVTNSNAFIEQIGFSSTKNYVTSVMRRQKMYRTLARLGL
jgi:soluble lytic murein transglycosylase